MQCGRCRKNERLEGYFMCETCTVGMPLWLNMVVPHFEDLQSRRRGGLSLSRHETDGDGESPARAG